MRGERWVVAFFGMDVTGFLSSPLMPPSLMFLVVKSPINSKLSLLTQAISRKGKLMAIINNFIRVLIIMLVGLMPINYAYSKTTYVPIAVDDITIIVPIGPQWSASIGGNPSQPICAMSNPRPWVTFFCRYMTYKQWLAAGKPLLNGVWVPVFWSDASTLSPYHPYPDHDGLIDYFYRQDNPAVRRSVPWGVIDPTSIVNFFPAQKTRSSVMGFGYQNIPRDSDDPTDGYDAESLGFLR